ncbi:Zeta_toxin domain-containing protein [Durusdinium trenchii]|uniref:Zeta_toxin domain-containing protein n=1 Tax=Durusdinium trenchii TaxID=1381693 RepID=A0ABP0RS18_9DINO
MKSSKLRHAWTFFLESTELKVELEHSRFSGKKKVLVDGKPVFATTEKQLSWCWEHPNTKAKILLESENGRHSLRCEEPEKLEQGPNEQLQSVSPRSCRSTTSVTGSRTPKTPAAEIDMAAEEVRQSLFGSFSDELQEHMDALDEEIAEEAIPSFPSCLTTRSQRRVSQEEVDTETARLNALLGVKNAQIAALQDELRRCALSKEGPAPAVDATPHAAPAPAAPEPVSPIQQLEGPKQPEHFLVAELPTLPVTPARERVVTPRRPASRNCSPGPNHQQPQPSPAVRRSSLDDEELDVSHRRGPVVSTPTPGTPCAAGRCMTPPRVSPVVVQRYVATPRRALTPPRRVVVAPQVEAPDTPIARPCWQHATTSAGAVCITFAALALRTLLRKARPRLDAVGEPSGAPAVALGTEEREDVRFKRKASSFLEYSTLSRAFEPHLEVLGLSYRSLSVQPPQRWRRFGQSYHVRE